MNQDPTRRFSVRVDAYERYRPSYPAAVAALAERECGLRAGQAVADIGCGTGLLARLFLERGCHVFGVEPNPDRKSTRLNSSHLGISYAVFCLKKKTNHWITRS